MRVIKSQYKRDCICNYTRKAIDSPLAINRSNNGMKINLGVQQTVLDYYLIYWRIYSTPHNDWNNLFTSKINTIILQNTDDVILKYKIWLIIDWMNKWY